VSAPRDPDPGDEATDVRTPDARTLPGVAVGRNGETGQTDPSSPAVQPGGSPTDRVAGQPNGDGDGDPAARRPNGGSAKAVSVAVVRGIKDAGAPVAHFLDYFGSHLLLIGRALAWLPRRPFRLANYLDAAEFIGFGSLPIVLLGFGLSTTQAAAAPIETAGATQCEVSGFSIDPDPKGTNVRSAPRADAPIIGHLAPRVRVTPVETTGVTFKILGSKDGWLLIRDGSPPTDFTLDPANAGDGRGWVSGRLVGTTLVAVYLRTAPQWDASAVANFGGSGHHRLHLLEVVDVVGWNAVAVFSGMVQQLPHRDDCHGVSLRGVDQSRRCTQGRRCIWPIKALILRPHRSGRYARSCEQWTCPKMARVDCQATRPTLSILVPPG
jgi:hypothetical protein